jgi:hypothetical protein
LIIFLIALEARSSWGVGIKRRKSAIKDQEGHKELKGWFTNLQNCVL